jgi:hypothetical protein
MVPQFWSWFYHTQSMKLTIVTLVSHTHFILTKLSFKQGHLSSKATTKKLWKCHDFEYQPLGFFDTRSSVAIDERENILMN